MPARPRSSLASQLALLNDAAPELDDRDPDREAAAAAAAASDDDNEDEDDAGEQRGPETSHYVDVGPSKLRKRAQVSESETLRDAKYTGVRAKAADFFRDEEVEEGEEEDDEELDSAEEEEEEDEDDDEEGDDGDEEIDSDEASGESGVEAEDSAPTKAKAKKLAKQLRFANDAKGGEEEEEQGGQGGRDTLASAARDDVAMVASLRQRNEADAERGEGVKRQMKAWENALGIRIRSQKVVHAAGRIEPRALPELLELAPGSVAAHEATLAHLASASASLLAIQLHTLRTEHADEQLLDEALATPDGLKAVRAVDKAKVGKRKRDGEALETPTKEEHLEAVEACLALDAAFDELHRAILDKWSSRTSTGTALASSENKFENASSGGGLRAVNQSVNAQIDRALEGDGLQRLIKRSRNWRSEEERIGAIKVGEGEEDGEDQADADVFDDTDFYQHLLRELIESKGAQATSSGVGPDSTNEWSSALKKHARKNGAKKRAVDTRASKGRKIRYEVNERLANFMPQIPNELWTEEQRDRLFKQLGGGRKGAQGGEKSNEVGSAEGTEDVDMAQDEGVDGARQPDLSGFKLFG